MLNGLLLEENPIYGALGELDVKGRVRGSGSRITEFRRKGVQNQGFRSSASLSKVQGFSSESGSRCSGV